MIEIDTLLLKIGQLNSRWLDHFAEIMPDIVSARQRHYSCPSLLIHSLMLRLVLLILPFLYVSKPPKYIFQGLRHRSLIEALPASEVLVLGGRGEFLYCLKRGYTFHWVGYIAKSFQLYVWAGKKEPFSKALIFIQKLFLAQAGEKRYLFLWEDSLPTGLTLSTALASIPGLNVVCIAHGMFPRYKGKGIPPEGEHCKFNLVWDASQKKLFKGGDDPATFVLGLPYEVNPPQLISCDVVLVGHCGRSSGVAEYFFSLYHFSKIFTILQRANITVSFRPHPQDDINFIRSIFPTLRVENKLDLFGSGRKAFIGFASTLLYEAGQCGNILIALDCSEFPYEIDFHVDGVVLASDYEKLPLYLSNLFDAMPAQVNANVESLSSRFYGCIKQIDEFNANKENCG